MSKPCSTDVLLAALGTGVEQYRLITSEKVLLEQTLGGAVAMLIEILSMVSPAAYARARRLQQYVVALAAALGLRERWQWPLAALVSQIGCVSMPKETLSKVEAGQPLSDEEQSLHESHPQLAAKMLQAIPRLEDVAAIVSNQNNSLSDAELPADLRLWDVRTAGTILLRAANEFDRQVAKGRDSAAAAAALRAADSKLPKALIEALKVLPIAGRERVMRDSAADSIWPRECCSMRRWSPAREPVWCRPGTRSRRRCCCGFGALPALSSSRSRSGFKSPFKPFNTVAE